MVSRSRRKELDGADARHTERLYAIAAPVFFASALALAAISYAESSAHLESPVVAALWPYVVAVYCLCGLLVYRRLRPSSAIFAGCITTALYFQVQVYWFIYRSQPIDCYNLTSLSPFLALVYITLFLFVPRYARSLSWAFLVILSLQLLGVFDGTRGAALACQAVVTNTLVASPLYVLALSAIFSLAQTATETRKLATELLGASETDPLTGLPNRRAVDEELLVAGEEGPVGVIVVDIDHFKRINDAQGHLAGDEVLRSVAGTIRGSLRPSDFAGRWGGEEFIVVVRKADTSQLAVLAERLRENIERSTPPHGLKVTASVGYAVQGPSAPAIAELIGQADGAMYQAKQTGRNKVVGAASAA